MDKYANRSLPGGGAAENKREKLLFKAPSRVVRHSADLTSSQFLGHHPTGVQIPSRCQPLKHHQAETLLSSQPCLVDKPTGVASIGSLLQGVDQSKCKYTDLKLSTIDRTPSFFGVVWEREDLKIQAKYLDESCIFPQLLLLNWSK